MKCKLFAPQDLTTGSVFKKLIIFAIPILISSLLGNAFGLINSLVLKYTVGGDAVTSINVTGSLGAILFNFAYGSSTGFAIITSNSYGEKKFENIKKEFINSTILCLIIGVFTTIIGLFVVDPMLKVLNVAPKFFDNAKAYFQIILISFVLMLLNNLFLSILRAIGDAFSPLIISFVTTILNILLALFFTTVCKLGVRGVALGTLLSYVITIIGTFIFMRKKFPYLSYSIKEFHFYKGLSKEQLKMGIPIGLQWSILFIGSFIVSSNLNRFGLVMVDGIESSMASKAAACFSPFEGYITMPLSVMGTATLSFIGQNYGAQKYDRIKQVFKTAWLIDATLCVFALVVGMPLVKYVPYIFLTKAEVNDPVCGPLIQFYCSSYLYLVIPSLILQGTLQLSRSFNQGVKKPIIPFLSGVGELIARAIVSYTFPLMINPTNPLSNASYYGLSSATPIAWLISVLIMGGSVLHILIKDPRFKKEKKEVETSIINKDN